MEATAISQRLSFPRETSCRTPLGVFEKQWRLYKALSGEDVSVNFKVAVAHKDPQFADLREHLLRSAVTLASVTQICSDVFKDRLTEAFARAIEDKKKTDFKEKIVG